MDKLFLTGLALNRSGVAETRELLFVAALLSGQDATERKAGDVALGG